MNFKENIYLTIGIGLVVVSATILTIYIVKNKQKSKQDEK